MLTLARRVPARMDVQAQTVLPGMLRRGRVAHQVRQDLWRALRRVRGFSPVVQVSRHPEALLIRAGGQIDGARPAGLCERIAAVLENPANRARWIAHGGVR